MQGFDEWIQNYQETINSMPELAFDSPTNNMAALTGDAMSSPRVSSSFSSNAGGLFPKASVGKCIRRRSRASKKTPTTLLNANANNFRALVQQFTGCHSAPPTFRTCKGPINLNFAQYSSKYSSDHEAQRQQQTPQDQSFFSFGANNNIAAAVSTTTTTTADDHEFFASSTLLNYNNPFRPDSLTTLDDFDIDKISLQDLSGPGDCSGTRNDEFWGY
ncbi:VQ motif-containing protein 22 [Sesamum alatum]|uniref:VQ motif-containing protein 22 n=1 Tax=Sesamum alatum TaxID=300844 RepID=A0AAE1Z1R1_9LAMI|nr:VQ motif-containing protein 22 [Sesamum alatum]